MSQRLGRGTTANGSAGQTVRGIRNQTSGRPQQQLPEPSLGWQLFIWRSFHYLSMTKVPHRFKIKAATPLNDHIAGEQKTNSFERLFLADIRLRPARTFVPVTRVVLHHFLCDFSRVSL